MRRFGCCSLWAVWLIGLASGSAWAAEPVAAPDFHEVYDQVRSHLAGSTDVELNRAAVQGFVSALSPRVALVNEGDSSVGHGPVLNKTSLLDERIGYVQVARVGSDLPQALRQACEQLGRTNSLRGLVIDLRFAGGDDYAAVAATAELFIKQEKPLLDWGRGMVQSKTKTEAFTLPVATLVNRQTAGAAEALAGALRASAVGLILGNLTAGEALITEDFPLKNGQRLRIGTAPIKLGDGSTLAGGLKPDIMVQVGADEERAYYADAYKVLAPRALASSAGAQTNGVARPGRRPRMNEADLVRERREGANLEEEPVAPRHAGTEKPVISDPVLLRALDLLKGLAVVRSVRS